MNTGGLFEFLNPIVNYINGIITKLVPGAEIILVAIISIAIAYAMKTKNGWSKFSFIAMCFVLFWAFRYLSIGGV